MQDSEKEVTTMEEILHPGVTAGNVDGFPHAPADWHPDQAKELAKEHGIQLTEDHLNVIRALQQYFVRHQSDQVNFRELHDALDERFHKQGGLKYLYEILPGGPIAQGCLLAGIKPPAGAIDESFGSVV